MKTKRSFPIVTVTPKAETAIKKGHPWVYDAEITDSFGDTANGCLVDVLSRKGSYLGTGLLSLESKIRVRILSSNANESFTPAFWERRLRYAIDYRRTVMGGDFSCCRLVFGEADGLPGLTVDRFSDLLSVQIASYGMDKLKDTLYPLLIKILAEGGDTINGIYERNDIALRSREGLEEYKGWYEKLPHPDSPVTEITENGIKYLVDVENGQKTGFFLDQKYNRLAMQRICKGKRVLDCFTHMGTFALNAGIAGALDVTGLDISEYAVSQATENARRNGLEDTVHFRCANVLDELPRLAAVGEKYDVVILDPPAFTKSREATKNAIKGYREINMKGLKLVKDGGYLATCSCSHFMTQELLAKTVKEAAKATHKRLRQVEFRTQAPDHPILWANSANVPESYYLKFFIFQVVDEK
mgnify:CR=1 FL=1